MDQRTNTALREDAERAIAEASRRQQMEMQNMRDKLAVEKESWEDMFMRKQQAMLREKVETRFAWDIDFILVLRPSFFVFFVIAFPLLPSICLTLLNPVGRSNAGPVAQGARQRDRDGHSPSGGRDGSINA